MTTDSSRNMAPLAHHELNGFGSCGEGLAIQLTRDGRRVLWLAQRRLRRRAQVVYTVDRFTDGLNVLELRL